MENKVIKIDGRKSIILNPNLRPEMGIYLEANYLGRDYSLLKVNLMYSEKDKIGTILLFDRNDRRTVGGQLNYLVVIALIHGAKGAYRATGIENLPDSKENFQRGIKFYRIGEPKVDVSANAEEAIKTVRDYERELREIAEDKSKLYDILLKEMKN